MSGDINNSETENLNDTGNPPNDTGNPPDDGGQQKKNILSGEPGEGNPPEAKTITLPGENATDEEKNAFFNAIGRPESADGYEIKAPEQMLPGMEWDDDAAKGFAEAAFAAGLTKSQAQAMLDYHDRMLAGHIEAAVKAHNERCDATVAKLQKEWGADYEKNIAQANKAMRTFGVTKTLEEVGLLADESIIRMFVKVGESLQESKLVDDGKSNAGNAVARLEELVNDKNSAYWNANDPNHKEAVAEVVRLLRVTNSQNNK